jgi:hypothetical protein
MPSVLVNSCEIVLPAPADDPFTFVATAVHVYVVPATELGLVIAMEVDSPEQMI